MYSKEEIEKKVGNESWLDTDWYFVDKNGKVAVVASAGGLLPDLVANDIEGLKKIITHFRSLPVISNEIEIVEKVLSYARGLQADGKKAYLQDLHFMSGKGLYYFDKVEVNNFYDFRYYLKSRPVKPLVLNNPDELNPIVKLEIDLDELKEFFVDQLPYSTASQY